MRTRTGWMILGLCSVLYGCLSGNGGAPAASGAQGSDPGGTTVPSGGGGSVAGSCATAAPGAAAWQNVPFAPQGGAFDVYLSATPQQASSDLLIGLAQGSQRDARGLATLVRFNPTNAIDVRDGGVYRAGKPYYQAGDTYAFKLEVDVPAKRYSVDVRERGDGMGYRIADGYAFRTEQQGVTALDTFVAAAEIGTLTACIDRVVPALQATAPAQPWQTEVLSSPVALGPNAVRQHNVVFKVRPMASGSDALIALAQGAPADANGLAAVVRFNAQGTVDVRNGDHYSADVVYPYTPGKTYYVEFAPVAMHPPLYSVSVRERGATVSARLATNYSYSSAQQGASVLDHWAVAATQGGLQAWYHGSYFDGDCVDDECRWP